MRSRILGPWVLCLLFVCPVPAYAEPGPVDVVVALDLSGSMKTGELKRAAQRMLAWIQGLGGANDRIGVVTFQTSSRVAQGLVPFPDFDVDELRRRTRLGGKYTDLAAGIEMAYEQLKNEGRPEASPSILLFSDGNISLPGGTASADRARKYIRAVLIPAMREAGIRVFALTPEGLTSDTQLLEALARKTGGRHLIGALPTDWKGLGPLRIESPPVEIVAPKPKAARPPEPEAPAAASPPPASPPPVKASSPWWMQVPDHWMFGGALVAFLLLLFVVVVPLRSVLRGRRRSQSLAMALEEVEALRRELDEADQTEPGADPDIDKATQEKIRLAANSNRDPEAWLN